MVPLFSPVAAASFVLLLLSAAALYFGFAEVQRARPRRLGAAPADRLARQGWRRADAGDSPVSRAIRALAPRLRQARERRASLRAAQNLLVSAGYHGIEPLVAFYALELGAAILGAGLGASLALWSAGSWPVFAVCGALVGYGLPHYVLRRMAFGRGMRLTRDMPAAMGLLVVSLEAGLGLAEAIRVVGVELERQGKLLGSELAAIAAELSAGVALADSLHNLGERTGVEEIKALAALLIQSEKLGARMGPALRAGAELMNTQRRLRAEEAAQRSAVKMLIPLVLLILPATMIVILGPAVMQIMGILHL